MVVAPGTRPTSYPARFQPRDDHFRPHRILVSTASPTVPLSHRGRLAAVRAAGLLGAAPLAGLERVARLAARALNAPVAQVNLLTFDQQVPVAA